MAKQFKNSSQLEYLSKADGNWSRTKTWFKDTNRWKIDNQGIRM